MPRPLNSLLLALLALLLLASGAAQGAQQPACSVSGVEAGAGAASKAEPAEPDWLALSETPAEKAAVQKETPVYVTALGFLLKLALVLVLAYLTILILKRFSGVRGAVGGGRQRIRVIEQSSLGANKALHLIDIGGRKLLVGSTPNQVSLIAELSPEELPDTVVEEPQVTGFRDQLALFLGGKPDTADSSKNVAELLRESTSFLQGNVGRLGQIRGKLRDA